MDLSASPDSPGSGSGLYRLPERPLLRYGFAVALVAVVFGLSLLFRAQLAVQPSIPFIGIVAATAFLAGPGPALAATLLSVLAIEYVFFDPIDSVALTGVQNVTEIIVFGSVALLISWLADRTERNRKALAEQRERAEAATRTRERIMAVVAHDLRNPLNVITSAAELLADPASNLSPDDTGRMLKRASEEAGELIEDLLDISRMEAGEFTVSPDAVPASELLQQAESSVELVAREDQLLLEVECSADEEVVYADPARMRRVFSNLLENALAYSPSGGRIRMAAVSEGDRVVFSVSDEGPGIPEKEQPYVFDHFWQGETARGGAGLGLAIVRGIVNAHGGRTWIETREGEGTSVFFTLPTANAS